MPAAVSPISLEDAPTTAPVRNAPPRGRHLYWIDWMRFLAAALVMLDHACQANWSGTPMAGGSPLTPFRTLLVSPIHLGRQAVVVFFVLSGALVGGLTLEKIRAGTFDAKVYAADRISRVYVPLIPALLLSIAVVRVYDHPVFVLQFIGCLLGLTGVVTHQPLVNGVLWTLTYEMWFYVLAGCAAVVAARNHRSPGGWLTALAGGALALGILCFRLDWINFVCWLVGTFGFALRHRIARTARPFLATVGLLLMLAGAAGFRGDLVNMVPGLATLSREPWLIAAGHLTLAAGTLLFIVSVCLSAPKTRPGAWIERLGTPPAAFSYTLYLTHYPLLGLMIFFGGGLPQLITWDSLFRLGWWMALCIAVAVVMYALFERQTPRVRRWLRARLEGGAARAKTVPNQGALAIEA